VLIKHLNVFLKKIFEVLIERKESPSVIFLSIIKSLEIFSQAKNYTKYTNIIINFIEKHFVLNEKICFILLEETLKYFKFDNKDDKKESIKIITRILKTFHFLIKFIIKSKNQFDENNKINEDKGENEENKKFYDNFNKLIIQLSSIILNNDFENMNDDIYNEFFFAQDFCIRNFSYIFESLFNLNFPEDTIGDITSNFLTTIPITGI
jgi:hypothetical protein